ncbi:MAG: hypothetical protein FJY98_03350 [Candidatus Liptonbacteria bacterium]|nr:hypothetical protein [Candidatus Liptonbacteria bacterium]
MCEGLSERSELSQLLQDALGYQSAQFKHRVSRFGRLAFRLACHISCFANVLSRGEVLFRICENEWCAPAFEPDLLESAAECLFIDTYVNSEPERIASTSRAVSRIMGECIELVELRRIREIHEGNYKPIISKKLFDKVQKIMKQKSRPRHKQKNEPQVFCGLMTCASCGMMITGEYRIKNQLNGIQHFYTYYHCTKKSKTQKCPEPCIREEQLDAQISSMLQKVSMPKDWADYLNMRLDRDRKESAQSASVFVEKNQKRIKDITVKLQRLLDGYLEQDIDKEIYRAEKTKLLSEKKSLEEEISSVQQKQNRWLEPIQKWINEAQDMEKIALDSNLLNKKVAAKKVFGSNLLLHDKTLRASAPNFTNSALNPGENPWSCLRHALDLVGVESKRTIWEPEGRIELPTPFLP